MRRVIIPFAALSRVPAVAFAALGFAFAACGGGSTSDQDASDVSMTDAVSNDASNDIGTDTMPSDVAPSDATDSPTADVAGDASCPSTPTGTAQSLTLTFSATCPFTACGGDPTGVWRYQSLCAADPTAPLQSMCPGISASATGTTTGSITLMGGFASRDVTVNSTVMANVPASCAVVGCMTIQSALMSRGYSDAMCTATSSGGCACQFHQTTHVMDCDTYTVVGTQIVTGRGVHYDFCVATGMLTYREQGTTPREPWTATLVPN
jgi:hypothetical protein